MASIGISFAGSFGLQSPPPPAVVLFKSSRPPPFGRMSAAGWLATPTTLVALRVMILSATMSTFSVESVTGLRWR